MLGYSTLEASRSLGRGPLLSLASHSKTRTQKENLIAHSHSRHTRIPSSRHVGGYLMLCRDDCCEEVGRCLSKQGDELLNHRNRKGCGLDA
jgi:hypothetical protein